MSGQNGGRRSFSTEGPLVRLRGVRELVGSLLGALEPSDQDLDVELCVVLRVTLGVVSDHLDRTIEHAKIGDDTRRDRHLLAAYVSARLGLRLLQELGSAIGAWTGDESRRALEPVSHIVSAIDDCARSLGWEPEVSGYRRHLGVPTGPFVLENERAMASAANVLLPLLNDEWSPALLVAQIAATLGALREGTNPRDWLEDACLSLPAEEDHGRDFALLVQNACAVRSLLVAAYRLDQAQEPDS